MIDTREKEGQTLTSIYWLIAFVVFVGIELATMALTTIWFAGGAFAAFVLSLLGANVEIQLAVFVLVSFLLLFLTRPFAKKYINQGVIKTNSDSLIGAKARVTEVIDNEAGTGTAVINGQEWTARAAAEGKCYEVGMMVQIKEINGVKLMVTELERQEEL